MYPPCVNPLPEKLWESGLSYERYRARAERNKQLFDSAYADPHLEPADLELLSGLPSLRLVAIAEDWCPDAFQTLPTWARAAEEVTGLELRVFARDENPELMDAFVWNGSARRIPVYAFYGADLLLQTWWSGRSATAQQELDDYMDGRSFATLSEDGKRQATDWLNRRYEESFRRSNLDEILALLAAFFHRS